MSTCEVEHVVELLPGHEDVRVEEGVPGGNCIKIGLPGKSILGYYFQENGTSQRPFLLLKISFPERHIFIQLPPEDLDADISLMLDVAAKTSATSIMCGSHHLIQVHVTSDQAIAF